MSASTPSRTLCLGEALVDLVGERRGAELTEVPAFSPHFGGVTANIAVVAARLGAKMALAGGAGDNGWGRWLGRHGVGFSFFSLPPEAETLLAFVSVDERGEPTYTLRGDAVGTVVPALG